MTKLMMALLLVGGTAQAQTAPGAANTTTTTTSTTTTATTAGAAATANDTPQAACRSMVENAKTKNFDAFMKMTTEMPAHAKKNMKATKGGYQKMQTQYMDRLQDLSCGNEIVAQDRAVVESESKNEKRLVPFIKTAEGWKFDMKTYQSFYDTDHAGHGKGAGKKKM